MVSGDFLTNTLVPEKFEKALLEFEDRRFYFHRGVDIFSVGRAIVQNFKEKRIVSGASTITMQLMRMSRGDNSRTIDQKIIETLWALRAEMRYNKKEILSLYSSNAPFGGNVVGLDAASWRYFGRSPKQLSWAESAMLAVLPNAPTIIHPSKNRKALFEKRNRLLNRLYMREVIDLETYSLSIEEPLPERPHPLPQIAPHLLSYFNKGKEKGKALSTTIDYTMQNEMNQLMGRHHSILSSAEIHNGALIVAEVKDG